MRNKSQTICPRQNPFAVSGQFDSDLMLFQQQSKQYYVLNTVASRIWQMCDGSRSVSEITTALKDEFDVPVEQLAEDVSQTIDGLAELGLIDQ